MNGMAISMALPFPAWCLSRLSSIVPRIAGGAVSAQVHGHAHRVLVPRAGNDLGVVVGEGRAVGQRSDCGVLVNHLHNLELANVPPVELVHKAGCPDVGGDEQPAVFNDVGVAGGGKHIQHAVHGLGGVCRRIVAGRAGGSSIHEGPVGGVAPWGHASLHRGLGVGGCGCRRHCGRCRGPGGACRQGQ